jgi:hypothetical protein
MLPALRKCVHSQLADELNNRVYSLRALLSSQADGFVVIFGSSRCRICFAVGKTWDNREDLEGEKEKWLKPSSLAERDRPS